MQAGYFWSLVEIKCSFLARRNWLPRVLLFLEQNLLLSEQPTQESFVPENIEVTFRIKEIKISIIIIIKH